MKVCRTLAVLAALVLPSTSGAQLPRPVIPRGTLRIEIGGGFYPTDHEWADGAKRGLGAGIAGPLDAGTTPLVMDFESRLTQVLGRPATAASLGHLAVTAETERGVASLGLAIGITRRITVFGTVPVVLIRSRAQIQHDPTGTTLGINPADPTLGTEAGAQQTAAFFQEFASAITQLADNINQGAYAGDPATLALAQQTLTQAPGLRDALFGLMADPELASTILPTAESSDGMALLGAVSGLRATFANRLGITSFVSDPALPAAPLTSDEFTSVLKAENGFDLIPIDDNPRVAIGDMEAGVALELATKGNPGDASWRALWARGLVRFPNGQLPRARSLFDQGTGDRQIDMELSLTAEAGRRRLGARVEATYLRQFPSNRLARLATRDQLLVPASREAAISKDLGDVFAITAQPYFRLASGLAISGVIRHWRKGADRTEYISGQIPIENVTLDQVDALTKADATLLGLGVNYASVGRRREGPAGLPVEAGFSIERTIHSGHGLVPSPLTSRVYLRIYETLFH